MERKTRFELATSSLARRRSTAELLPHFLLLYYRMVPRRRFELLRAYAHHPLKMACLPDSTTSAFTTRKIYDFAGVQFWQGRQDSNPRPAVLETAALPSELHPCITGFQVPLGRFERPTRGLGNRCSIHLSYRGSKLRLVPSLLDYVALWCDDLF
jgi:hypothetical protein